MSITKNTHNLETLKDQMREYVIQAKSENTRKAYQSDFKDFVSWCQEHELDPIPASPELVCAYLTERAKTLKVSSLERRLVAIRQAHVAFGHSFDKNNSLITEVMKGIRNVHGQPQVAKAPITIDILKKMIEHLDDSTKGMRDKSILVLGFIGALRRSEIVDLRVEDISFVKNGIELTITKSKTDQKKEGVTLPIPYGSSPETCPVRAVQDWLEASKIEEGPLFRSINRHGHMAIKKMTCASIALIIKRNMFLEGTSDKFSGHSLRAGFCTQAALAGLPEHAIMRQSRHKKSDTLRKYIRIGSLWKNSAATQVGL